MSFYEVLKEYPASKVLNLIYSATESNIISALNKDKPSIEELAYLLNPNADKYLDKMAERSRNITLNRFGKTIKIYAPMYLSNYCSNGCVYCGFNTKNKILRKALSMDEIKKEAELLSSYGIQNIILVTGDNFHMFSFEKLMESVKICLNYFPFVSIEVPSLTFDQYKSLSEAGVNGITMFQETYLEEEYNDFHPFGPKSDFLKRLNTPELAAKAGIRYIGLGSLLGLTDFRLEVFYLCLHSKYLLKKYWKSHISASFPRIRQAAGDYKPKYTITNRNLFHMIFVYRMFLHDCGINISTREPKELRDKLAQLGATIMSAGSKTEPGGYNNAYKEAGQFSIEDERTVAEFCCALKNMGLDPVLKDWDMQMNL